MPLMPEGIIVRFNRLLLRDPTDKRRVRAVEGEYKILHRRLVYSASHGLLQYLEMGPEAGSSL